MWSERSSGGRPGGRCEYVHRRAMSWLCQRSSVSGLNRKTVQAGRGSERLSAVNSARSAGASFGRGAWRRRIASSRRRTRISASFERRGRPSSHTSANRFRATRYTNDQSSSPPSTTTKNTEPSELDARESRGRVCEPYGHSAPCVWRGAAGAAPLCPHCPSANVEDRAVTNDSWRRRLDRVVGLEALRRRDTLEDPGRCAGSVTTDSQHALLTV